MEKVERGTTYAINSDGINFLKKHLDKTLLRQGWHKTGALSQSAMAFLCISIDKKSISESIN